MKYLICSFKNRTSLYTFIKILKNINIFSQIVNTPHNISKSCGLSAKINYIYQNSIINVAKTSQITDLIGIFLIEKDGLNERIQRLY